MRKKPTPIRRKKKPEAVVVVERYEPNETAMAAWIALWDMLLDWMTEEEQAA